MSLSVPLVIDDVKRMRDFEMSRCIYFSIECDVPWAGWTMDISKNRIPFLMVGLSGIIYVPAAGREFDEPEEFESLFNLIEKQKDIYVETNDLWIPNFAFSKSPVQRGEIYRIGEKFFHDAYKYRENIISADKFIGRCTKSEWQALYSAKETKAWSKWNHNKIQEAKQYHERHSKENLKKQFGKGEK